MMDESFLNVEPVLKRSNSMFLHPSPDIDLKVIKQIGDYSLGTELGSGAFGKVVLGRHILTNEPVAVKILDKMILSQTPDDYQSVKQEINILKSVKHKHIVQLYEVMQTPRHIFIIMEYCEGKDLLDYILTKSRLSEEESLKYFHQLINALFYLHSQNIAHRDIKIDNMLLDRNRDLKLVDFGLSTKYPDDNLLDQPCGTVVYAAPEVLQGREYHGMLADVWSSGIVLYGMLSGYLPFGEQDDEINRMNIISGKIKYPSYFSNCVKDLLMHMLDLDPMTRYTLQEVRSHPWFNLIDYKLIPGIIIGYNIIPVDEKILDLCVTYNCDKNKVKESIINNKHNSESALYYLLIKKLQKKGMHSVSDFCSDEFINFVLDDNNLIDEKNNNKILPESEIKYNININANNNCSAPPDGKLRNKENQNNKDKNAAFDDNKYKEEMDYININKRINFENENETPRGALSYILNSKSFEDTNKELFNQNSSLSLGNKHMKNIGVMVDIENKKTNKNTSSDSRQKNNNLQQVTVNDFQIIDVVQCKKGINDDANKNENKLNLNDINNNMGLIEDDLIDNDYKMLNVFYNNTENDINDSINNNIEANKKNIFDLNKRENIYISANTNDINDNNNCNNRTDNYNNYADINNKENKILNKSYNHNNNSLEIKTDRQTNSLMKNNNIDILSTPIITPPSQENNNGQIKEILINFNKLKERKEKNENDFKIETPQYKKTPENNKNNFEEEKNSSKNTLSKQKVYIDKTKTYSDKNKPESDNKRLDLNKIKDIRKINLFQDEIKEENDNKIEKEKEKENELDKEDIFELKIKNDIQKPPKMIMEDISLVNDSNDISEKNKIIEKVIVLNQNIQEIKEKNTVKENDNVIEIKKESSEINNKDKSQEKDNEKNQNQNQTNKIKKIAENKNISQKDKNKKKIKENNKISIKKKENNSNNKKIKNNIKMKNPLINSIMKNYKSIIDTNKSIEIIKSNKVTSKDKNSYSSKHRMKKNKEKEIVSIKVIINKDLKSKEKNKYRNSILKNRTEQQERKIISIYNVGIIPNNLAKNGRYTVINKKAKPNSSIPKNRGVKNIFTTIKKPVNNNANSKEINKTHIKSSSIQIFNTAIKNKKYISKYINTYNNAKYNSLKINNLIKSKIKKNSNSKNSNNQSKTKSVLGNNFLMNTYNNKYMNLFRSTQYKNNQLLFTNKIEKKNLNKKFSEIAQKIHKNNKINLNNNNSSKNHKNESKKIPLWKYIQSDFTKNNNNINVSSSVNINKKKVIKINNANKKGKDSGKNLKEKDVKNKSPNGQIKSSNIINLNKIQKMQKSNKFFNINKLINNNNKNKCNSKEKNINVIFINIKNYINDKNDKNIKKQNNRYLESSASNQKYKSVYNYRDLSESVKNKYLNKKTRFMRIPWKMIKKALDEKKDLDELYKMYVTKNANPFKRNGNNISKNYNIKPIHNNAKKNI